MTSCNKDIISHLRTIKAVSQTSLPTERDLIVARTGHFREDGADMTIYPGHCSDLEVFWPARRKCAHPLSGNQKSKKSEEHLASYTIAETDEKEMFSQCYITQCQVMCQFMG